MYRSNKKFVFFADPSMINIEKNIYEAVQLKQLCIILRN